MSLLLLVLENLRWKLDRRGEVVTVWETQSKCADSMQSTFVALFGHQWPRHSRGQGTCLGSVGVCRRVTDPAFPWPLGLWTLASPDLSFLISDMRSLERITDKVLQQDLPPLVPRGRAGSSLAWACSQWRPQLFQEAVEDELPYGSLFLVLCVEGGSFHLYGHLFLLMVAVLQKHVCCLLKNHNRAPLFGGGVAWPALWKWMHHRLFFSGDSRCFKGVVYVNIFYLLYCVPDFFKKRKAHIVRMSKMGGNLAGFSPFCL